MANCPYCGMEMEKTSWGRYFCANHGIVEKDEVPEEPNENNKSNDRSYIN